MPDLSDVLLLRAHRRAIELMAHYGAEDMIEPWAQELKALDKTIAAVEAELMASIRMLNGGKDESHD